MLQWEVKTEEPCGLACLPEYTESILAYTTTCVCAQMLITHTHAHSVQREALMEK